MGCTNVNGVLPGPVFMPRDWKLDTLPFGKVLTIHVEYAYLLVHVHIFIEDITSAPLPTPKKLHNSKIGGAL